MKTPNYKTQLEDANVLIKKYRDHSQEQYKTSISRIKFNFREQIHGLQTVFWHRIVIAFLLMIIGLTFKPFGNIFWVPWFVYLIVDIVISRRQIKARLLRLEESSK